jgi:hypothetical protein
MKKVWLWCGSFGGRLAAVFHHTIKLFFLPQLIEGKYTDHATTTEASVDIEEHIHSYANRCKCERVRNSLIVN